MQPERFSSQARTGVSYDAGLRSHFQRVYNTMSLGLVVTGLTAYVVASSPSLYQFFYAGIMHWIVMLAPFGILLFGFTPGRIEKMSVQGLTALFAGFSAIFGVSLAYIFLLYTGESIVRVFFITAAMFAGTSIYGYTTKKDLSGLGGLMVMGLIGIIVASLVNIFMKSEMVHFVISIIGVVVFTGLTAWDTQRIKETYYGGSGSAAAQANAKMAVMGALSLYLNFINLFLMLLRLMGDRR